MLLGGAAEAGTVRAGIDRESPEHRGRFRKGFPARSEEASPAVRAEGCRGRGVSPGFSPRCRAGAPGDDETGGSHRGAAAPGPPLPHESLQSVSALGGSGAGAAPAGLLLRGRAWARAGRSGERAPSPGAAAVADGVSGGQARVLRSGGARDVAAGGPGRCYHEAAWRGLPLARASAAPAAAAGSAAPRQR